MSRIATDPAPAHGPAVDVGAVADFTEGTVTAVSARGVDLAVACFDGDLYAIRDACPHQQARLCRGTVRPVLGSGASGAPALEVDRGVVVCPWHRWEYDLRTGVGLRKQRYRVRTYRVKVVDDRVLVQLEPAATVAS